MADGDQVIVADKSGDAGDKGGQGGDKVADTTLLSGDNAGDKGGEKVADKQTSAFSDKWREELATGDDGKIDADWLKKLERYKSPKDYDKAHRAAVAKILEGAKSEPLPANPTPEQVTAWRKANGIPDKHDGYEIKLGEGMVIDEGEKPLVDAFMKKAHDGNASPAFVNMALNWYCDLKEAQLDARAETDRTAKAEAEEHLRETMGPDFKTNLNLIGGMIDTMPENLRDRFRFARLQDGTPIGADAEMMTWLAGTARQLNPIGTVIPLGSGNAGADAEKELATLKAEMGNPRSTYWVGSEAQKKQDRFAELSKALSAGKR